MHRPERREGSLARRLEADRQRSGECDEEVAQAFPKQVEKGDEHHASR
jgi:hypothetical protein